MVAVHADGSAHVAWPQLQTRWFADTPGKALVRRRHDALGDVGMILLRRGDRGKLRMCLRIPPVPIKKLFILIQTRGV